MRQKARCPFFEMVAGCSFGKSPSRSQGDDALRACGQVAIMRNQDQGRARFPVEVKEQIDDGLAGIRVEIARGFVGKEDARPVDKRPCDPYALLLSARELRGIMRQPVPQAHAVEQFFGVVKGPGFAAQFKGHHHIFKGREGGDELKTLKHKAHVLIANGCALVLIEAIEGHAIKRDRARTRAVKPGTQAEQRGLATARRPHNRASLPFENGKRDVVQNRKRLPPARINAGQALHRECDVRFVCVHGSGEMQ